MTLQFTLTLNGSDPSDLESWAMRYFTKKLPQASILTIGNWQTFLRKLVKFLKGPGTLADLNKTTLSDFMRHVVKTSGPGAANASAEKFLSLWRWLVEERIVLTEPPSPNPRALANGIIVWPKPKPGDGHRYKRRWESAAVATPENLEAITTMREAMLFFYKPGDYSQHTIDDMVCTVDRWEEFGSDKPVKELTDADFEEFGARLKGAGFGKTTGTAYVLLASRLLRRVKRQRSGIGRRAGETVLAPMPEPEATDGTLWSYFHVLYRPHRLRGASPDTIRNYTVQFRHFKRFLCRAPVLSDLTEETIGNVMDYIHDLPRSPRTANKFADMMLAFWGYLAKRRIVEQYPESVERFPEPELSPVAWRLEEMAKLRDACKARGGAVGNVAASTWWLAIVSMIWNTGERRGAVGKLEWSDVDLDRGFVVMRSQNRKGRKKPKTSKLHPVTVGLLREMREAEPEGRIVFAHDRCTGTIYKILDQLLQSAGLPHGRLDKFHKLRKSAATWFEVLGGDAQKLLCHSSRRTTERYLDEKILVPMQAADVLPSLEEIGSV